MSMDTEESLKEYLRLQLKVPLLARIGPLARTFDFVANAAPGVKEILTVGKFLWEVRERHYDLVVVDAVGHRPHRRPARRAAGASTSWCRSAWSATRPAGCSTSSPTRRRTGAVDRRHARGDAGHRDARAGRAASGPRPSVDLAAVVVNRVLPELFGRGEEEIFDRLREPERGRRARRSRRAAPVEPVLDARRAGRDAAPHPRRAPHPPARRAARRRRRCSTCPYLFTRAPRRAGHPHGRRGPRRRSSGTDGRRAPKRAGRPPARSSSCSRPRRSSSTAARVASARPRRRPPPRPMAAAHLGGKVLVLTVDPARRLANALGLEQFGNVETPGARRGRSPRPASSRAASCGRPCSTPSSRGTTSSAATRPTPQTRDAILANPLYQNITGQFVQSHDYIAMERLYEIHASGRYDLIVVDTPPTRNAIDFLEAPERMADFFSQPAAALADRAVPVARASTARRSPSTPSPTASSARSSSRTSPSSSSCSRRCTTASSSGPTP